MNDKKVVQGESKKDPSILDEAIEACKSLQRELKVKDKVIKLAITYIRRCAEFHERLKIDEDCKFDATKGHNGSFCNKCMEERFTTKAKEMIDEERK